MIDLCAGHGQPAISLLDTRRLWSLWDMLKFNAEAFYKATTAMQHTLSHIEAKDLKSIRNNPDGSATVSTINDPVFLKLMRERCDELQELLSVLGTRITQMAVADLKQSGTGLSYATFEGLAGSFRDIRKTLERELSLVTLLALNAREQEWYEPPKPPFGPDFEAKFASAAQELDEALKCLALGRSTASVFHLMRLMEVGLNALADCLGAVSFIRGNDRNWGNILKGAKDAMEAKTKGALWTNAADKDFFAESHASLDAVRVAWRNTTMHVERTYTPDQAEHVLGAVKGFMQNLSSRMDEKGDPKA
jgi:hypothetical protein